jgi:hypothetical protein
MVVKTGQGATSISKNQEQAMRPKIVRCVKKSLFQSSLYSLLLGALLTPESGWAAGWTQQFGKVIGTWSNVSGVNILLDPQSANNVNNCAAYIGQSGSGQSVAVFVMLYPAAGAPSEAQKVMISQVLLAATTGKPIKIYSTACNGTNANSVDAVWLYSN